MEMTLALLKNMVILFIYMGVGFALVKLKIFKSDDSKVFSLLIINVLLPCTMLKAFQADYSPAIRNGFLLALLGSALMYAIFYALLYGPARPLKLNAVEKGSILFPNSGNLIMPLVLVMLGDKFVIFASANFALQGVFLWTHGVSMMKGEKTLQWGKALKNINIICIIIGLIMFFNQIKFPGLVNDALDGMSNLLGPLSMMMIGMIIADVKWGSLFKNKRLYLVLLLRMIIFPVVVLCVFKYTGIENLVHNGQMIMYVTFLASAAPSAALISQMAQLYGKDVDYAAAINVVSTLICIVTMPLLTMWYFA